MTKTSLLSEAQVESYHREGYLVVPGLAAEAAVDAVVAAARGVEVPAGGDWTPRIFDHAQPRRDAELHQLLVDERVVGAAEQLLEAPARVYYGMLAVVPPRGGKGLAWHQDNQYDHQLGRALNVFLALCDITPEMAILWVAPRSHLLGVQPGVSSGAGHLTVAVEPTNGVPLAGLRKGDACIFDRSLLHRSLTNQTDMPRYAYAAQFIEAKARRAQTGKPDASKMLASELRAVWAAGAEHPTPSPA